MKAVEGELAGLDAHVVEVEQALGGFLNGQAEHNAGGQFDEIYLQHLAHEWEGATGAEVTFDDLNLVIACQELDIERARDM